MDVRAVAFQSVWDDIHLGLQTGGSQILSGEALHWHVWLDGRHSFQSGAVLVRGLLLASWQSTSEGEFAEPFCKVLVRMSLTDWFGVASHCGCIRVLQTRGHLQQDHIVLDATEAFATVSGDVCLRADETIQVAELFAGGYNGWHQAATVIHRNQLPMRTRFSLDRDRHCAQAATITHDQLTVVDEPEQLFHALTLNQDVNVVGDVDQRWWMRGLAQSPIEAWCASPPCQPFSKAASGPGVKAADGKALLHVRPWQRFERPKCFCVEQVRPFACHDLLTFWTLRLHPGVVTSLSLPGTRTTCSRLYLGDPW